MKQAVELSGMKLGKTIALGFRESTSRQYDPVVRVAADNEPTGAVYYRRLRRVIVSRQELRQAVPSAVPRRPDRVAHTVFESQLLRNLPAILHVPVECRGDPGGDRLASEFRIIVEVAKQRIRH